MVVSYIAREEVDDQMEEEMEEEREGMVSEFVEDEQENLEMSR